MDVCWEGPAYALYTEYQCWSTVSIQEADVCLLRRPCMRCRSKMPMVVERCLVLAQRLRSYGPGRDIEVRGHHDTPRAALRRPHMWSIEQDWTSYMQGLCMPATVVLGKACMRSAINGRIPHDMQEPCMQVLSCIRGAQGVLKGWSTAAGGALRLIRCRTQCRASRSTSSWRPALT
jgi:hypothetical protein